MKILQIIHSVDPRGGGPIEGVRQLVPALARLGIATEVMSLDAPGAPGTVGFPAPLFTTGPSRRGYGYNRRAIPWLKNHSGDYDALVVNGLWQYPGLAVWSATRRSGTPYFVYAHGMLDPWFKRRYTLKHLKKWLYWPWAEYRVLRDAAAVLFTTEEERLEARKSFWLYRCREAVTGFGITPPPGEPDRQRALFFERFPGLQGKRLMLFLGRIHEKKGCDLLLRGWAEWIAAEGGGDLQLVMAGPVEPAYGERLSHLANDLGVSGRVTWTGMLSGEIKWGSLRAAEAFILPSHQENFGVSVVEALACGLPVLISDKVNIWREIVADQAGLVEKDDLQGIVLLLQRWQSLEPDQRQKMGVQAQHCFAQRFDMAITAQNLRDIFRTYTV